MSLKGTKTEQNLKDAFAGESQARNKYTFFAEVAREEGYHYIAKIFEETAFNEMQHAKDHLTLLNGIGDTVAMTGLTVIQPDRAALLQDHIIRLDILFRIGCLRR